MSAYISNCGRYRYWLHRVLTLSKKKRVLVVVMLNPSIADGTLNDPTIRRVMGFALAWGFTEIKVVNLYAYRATDPEELWTVFDPIGPENDYFIHGLASTHEAVLCAWGSNAPMGRQRQVCKILEETGAVLMCLGRTRNGSPLHPLYVKSDTMPVGFSRNPDLTTQGKHHDRRNHQSSLYD